MCLALGFPHPDHLMHALTARQWQDWIEWSMVEPIGEEREDYRTAFAAAGLAACWSEDVEVDQFRIDWLKDRASNLSIDEKIKLRVMGHNARVEGT